MLQAIVKTPTMLATNVIDFFFKMKGSSLWETFSCRSRKRVFGARPFSKHGLIVEHVKGDCIHIGAHQQNHAAMSYRTTFTNLANLWRIY